MLGRLGWNGAGPGSQSEQVLNRCAHPCMVARFFAAVKDSAVARYDAEGAADPKSKVGEKLPPMMKPVGGYYHSLAISTGGRLFSWGCGNFGGENDGQQGFGDLAERTDPAPVRVYPISGEMWSERSSFRAMQMLKHTGYQKQGPTCWVRVRHVRYIRDHKARAHIRCNF